MKRFATLGRWVSLVALLTACSAPTAVPTVRPPTATVEVAVATATKTQPDATATAAATATIAAPATETSVPATATTAATQSSTETLAPSETAAPTEAATVLPTAAGPRGTLILATTTSTADTGLLAAILPYFRPAKTSTSR